MAAIVARATLDLLLPRTCALCAALAPDASDAICRVCWSRVQPLPHPQCHRCGHPVSARRAECPICATLPPYVRCVRSFTWAVDGPALATVHALKYAGWRSVAEGMGERMSRLAWPADVVEERAAVIPVPLAPSRRRERGFNQAELLARALAARWDVPLWPMAIARTRATVTQTQLTPDARRDNVRGAFRAAPSAPTVRGAHLVLVDDVLTTGATLNACALALREAGARIVSYVTFARAPAPGDRR